MKEVILPGNYRSPDTLTIMNFGTSCDLLEYEKFHVGDTLLITHDKLLEIEGSNFRGFDVHC